MPMIPTKTEYFIRINFIRSSDFIIRIKFGNNILNISKDGKKFVFFG